MSTEKIKELIDKLNKRKEKKGRVSYRVEKKTVNKIGDFFIEEIRKDFIKEVRSRPGHQYDKDDYYKIANETLKRILKKMERIEETEK